MPPASEPASGSERQYEKPPSPRASAPRYFCLSSSEPAICTGSEPSLLTAGISEDETHARATSSITSTVASASAPGTAVLLGHVGGVEVRGEQRRSRLVGVARLLVDSRRERCDLRVGDGADCLADRLVLLGEGVEGELAHGSGL